MQKPAIVNFKLNAFCYSKLLLCLALAGLVIVVSYLLHSWPSSVSAKPGMTSASSLPLTKTIKRSPSGPNLAALLAASEIKKITVGDGAAGDEFGVAMAVSGSTLVVGAHQHDEGGNGNQGVAYVFERNQGGPDNWGLVKRLTHDGAAENYFGAEVVIDGDTIVVTAFGNNSSQGAAYVFERNQGGANNWGEVKKLTASDGAAGDLFGRSAAIVGNTVIIGADHDDGNRGSIYIFERDQGGSNNWGEVKKLRPDDIGLPDTFGTQMAISNDTLIVSAPSQASSRGAAYVFERNQGGANNWGLVKKLLANDGAAGDAFGEGVAVRSDLIVVGAKTDDVGGNINQGSAYVFERNQGGINNWGQVQQLTGSDATSGDLYGNFGERGIAITDTQIIIGAYQNESYRGAAYIFERNQSGAWTEVQKLTSSDIAPGDQFGYTVAVSGSTLFVSSFRDDSGKGSAYVFSVTPTCPTIPSGLVSWWRAEGNGQDSVGGNHGAVEGSVTFAPGRVGQAFKFNGNQNDGINLGNVPAFDFTPDSSFTLEAWINPAVIQGQSIFSLNYKCSLTAQGIGMAADPPHVLGWGLRDANGNGVSPSPAFTLPAANSWYHVVGTREVTASGKTVKMYVNGALIVTAVDNTTGALANDGPDYIGRRYPCADNTPFNGLIDEVAVYNRALTDGEVLALYNVGSAGMCTCTAPSITTQPADQSVAAGSTAIFTANASGNPTAQWQMSADGGATFTDIPGATDATLAIASVNVSHDGNRYRAIFTNSCGSVTTAMATLAVLTTCAPQPTGLVSWWRAEGNGQDSVGGNHGAVEGTVTFGPGRVGQAFKFNGNQNDGINLGNVPAFDFTPNSSFTLEAWINPAVIQHQSIFSLNYKCSLTAQGIGMAGDPPHVLGWGLRDANGNGLASTPTYLVTANTWYHVVGTREVTAFGKTVKFYVNGVLIGTAVDNTTGALANDGPDYIGRRYPCADNTPFNGLIDEVAVYNRALTDSEVLALYNTGGAGKCVCNAPSVNTNPTNQTAFAGGTAVFTAEANGDPTPTVQWQVSADGGATFNDLPSANFSTFNAAKSISNDLTATQSGAISTDLSSLASASSLALHTATLTLHNVTAAQNGNRYRAVFTNSCGTATTTAATLTVVSCTPALSPASQSFTAAGGTGSVSVTLPSGCNWTASSNATAWITITSGGSGSGNGTVAYSVTANASSARTGTLTIAGQTFTVTQDSGCTYAINPTSQSFTPSGGAGSANVTTAAGCAWTAVSNASWITINSGASGSGNGVVAYSVAANTGAARTGTMIIAGQTFNVAQGTNCAYTINPASRNIAKAGGTGTVNVKTAAGCNWTAVSNVTWITITAGASGSGNGPVNYSVATNSGPERTGTLTIAGLTFTITQASGCAFTISPTSQSFTPSGGAGGVNVTTAAGCAWTAVSNASWITINSGASGSGDGVVAYSVAANTGAARTGKLTIAGQTFTITQGANCVFTINPASRTIAKTGGAGAVSVKAPAGCNWTAVSNVMWITITAGASGSGNGSVSYSVAANSGLERTGTLTIAGQTFTITQKKN